MSTSDGVLDVLDSLDVAPVSQTGELALHLARAPMQREQLLHRGEHGVTRPVARAWQPLASSIRA